MVEFQSTKLHQPIPHILPFTNLSLSKLQRGNISEYDYGNGDFGYTYDPPSLNLYTQFSIETYFFVFWIILFLQSLTIFVVDKIWIKNIPKSATLWERILHAIEKSSFPFPYINWHQQGGSCHDHLRRKQAVDLEVSVSILINLLYNIILLAPLPIFCKKFCSMILKLHSMAMGNLNKSKETMPTATTALKVAPQRTIFHKN